MKHTGFIARRYLFSKKHISLISTLTGISITGVTIGTALLIVVLSVFNGFFDVIKGFLLSYDPDIRIESAAAGSFMYDEQMLQEIRSIPGVTVVSPFVKGKVLMAGNRNRDQVITVQGMSREDFLAMYNFDNSITDGLLDISVRNKQPGILVPLQVRDDLRLRVGDPAILLSAEGMQKALTQFTVPRTLRFQVRGVYSVKQITSEPVAYIDLEAAQRLFNYRQQISGIEVRLEDNEKAEQMKKRIQERLGDDYRISTWYDLQKPLYDVMYLEKWGSYLILMIIVLVAVLNIVGSLTMIVIQKSRDIGVLLTMGYTPQDIRKIFIKQGFYIGFIGCGIGGALGLLLSWLQQQYGLLKLSSAFILEAYPVSINPSDVFIILGGSLLLCMAASWYPSVRAASVQPAEAVRYE